MTESAADHPVSDDQDTGAPDYSWIYGDGDAANTYLKIVDLDGGKTYDESFQDFTSKYEAMADATGWNLQMMHY